MTNKHSKSKDDSWHIIDIHIIDTDRLCIDKSIDIYIYRYSSLVIFPDIHIDYTQISRYPSRYRYPSQGDLFSISSGARLLFGSLALGIALAIVARHGPADGPWRKDVGNMGDLYGFVQIGMDLYGFTWICMDLYGFIRICRLFLGLCGGVT